MKVIVLPLIVFIFLFITDSWVLAQSPDNKHKIKGKLISGDSQLSLSYIALGLYNAKDTTLVKGTLTEDDGEFAFDNPQDGVYLIAVNDIGFKNVYNGPYILDNQHIALIVEDILLIPEVRKLTQVEITALKPLIQKTGNKTIINVASSSISAGNTALEIISRAPGVTIDNAGNISLKGKSGVTIMIDNKLTYLSPAQLNNMLRSMDGNAIQTIEISSNPPSRYDASGTGGIINIKLKKNDAYGTNGTATAGAGYGTYYKSEAGINLNHRSKSVNIFGIYNYLNNKNYEGLKVNRSVESGKTTTYFNQLGKQTYTTKNSAYKAGVDYNIGTNNTLGGIVSGYENHNKTIDQSITRIGNSTSVTDSSVIAQNSGKNQYANQTFNLNYRRKIDTTGQEFTANIDHSRVRNEELNTYNNYFYSSSGNSIKEPIIFLNNTPSKINIWASQLDYVLPFSTKTKLETGLKGSYVETDNDFQSENLVAGSWVNDVTRSNQFNYKEQIYAAYLNLHKELASTTLELGLRTEFTRSEGNIITLQNVTKQHYLDFFPNISVNQSLNRDHEVAFSYSRRIDRPDYQSLNPFIYYADLYTRAQGNPWLKPQYANSFELSYNYKNTSSITLGYIHTNNVITTVLLSDTATKTLLITEQNLASNSTSSININKSIAITKWWNTNNDATLYYGRFSSPSLMGMPFKSGKLTWLVNTVQSFIVKPSLTAELSGNYTSGQAYGTYIAKPFYGIDMGLSKTFGDKRATIKLAANDIFNQRKISIRSAFIDQDYRLSQKQESRIFRLSFSYNFGSSSGKSAGQYSGGLETEQSRVKSGN